MNSYGMTWLVLLLWINCERVQKAIHAVLKLYCLCTVSVGDHFKQQAHFITYDISHLTLNVIM